MGHDETDGWIFSDGYHQWQDRQRKYSYRHGSEFWLDEFGWSYDLFTIKTDPTGVKNFSNAIAQWPNPLGPHDLLDRDNSNYPD